MITRGALPQEAINFVNKHNRRLQLASEAEERRYKLVGLTEPLVCERRDVHINKGGAALLGERLGEHGLARTRRTVEKHAFRCTNQAIRATEQIRQTQRRNYTFL